MPVDGHVERALRKEDDIMYFKYYVEEVKIYILKGGLSHATSSVLKPSVIFAFL